MRIYIKELRPVSDREYNRAMQSRYIGAQRLSRDYRTSGNRNSITTVLRGAYIPEYYIVNGKLFKECLISTP